jgi:hypothetical protein
MRKVGIICLIFLTLIVSLIAFKVYINYELERRITLEFKKEQHSIERSARNKVGSTFTEQTGCS